MKNKNFKIRLSGWSALLVFCCIIALGIGAGVFIPLFIMFGLYNILAKFDYAHIDLFESFWHDVFYFGGFTLLLCILVFTIDFMTLFLLAAFKIQLTTFVDLLSIVIQMFVAMFLFNKFLLPCFNRVSIETPGVWILFALLYCIIAVFSYEKKTPAAQ